MVSLVTFHVIMFLMLNRMALACRSSWWRNMITKIILALILLMVVENRGDVLYLAEYGLSIQSFVMFYAMAVPLLCIAASLNCFKNMEIESYKNA